MLFLLPATLRAQNLQVIMTNNYTSNPSTGSANVSSNYQNLGNIYAGGAIASNNLGWSTLSTAGANVLFNLTNNAVVTWGTTTSWQAQSLNVTNGNKLTLEPSTNSGSFRITLGNATSAGGSVTNPWATNANGSFDDVFLTNGSDLTITNNGASTPYVQLYYNGSNNFDIGGGSTLTLDCALSGSSSYNLNKTGAGLMILAGAYSSSATAYINGGTVQVGNGGTTGAIAAKVVDNSSLVFDLSTATASLTNTISGTGSVTQNGTGKIALSGTNTYTGGTIINSGTIQTANASALGGVSASLTFAGAGTLDLDGIGTLSMGGLNGSGTNGLVTNSAPVASTLNLTLSGANSFDGIIKDEVSGTNTYKTSLQIASASTGSQTLSGGSTYTGGTTIAGGTLYLGNSNALGSSTGALTISGGTLNLGGLTVTEGATTFTAGTVTNGTLSSASYTFANPNAVSVSATLGGSGSLTLTGKGNVTLTGVNTFSGGTSIGDGLNNGGSLTASSLGSGGVALNPATITNANSTLNVSTRAGGTFSVGTDGFLMNGYANGGINGTAIVNLQNPNTTIASTGPINLYGSVAFDDVINLGTGWNIGTNVLISGTTINGYTNPPSPPQLTLSGNLLTGGTSLELGSSETIGRTTYTFNTNATQVILVIAGGAANLNWTGAVNTAWDTQTTTNWYNTDGASNDVFYSGDNVTFSTNSPVNVTSGGVSAGSVTVTNASATTFTMGGGTVTATGLQVSGGGIFVASNSWNIESGTLIVTNSSTVDLYGTNTFGGVTVTGAGTLILDNFNAVTNTTISVNGGYITLNHNNNDTINSGVGGATITNSGSQTLTGSLSGSGGFTFDGSGTIVFAANNTQSGGITLQSGTLQLGTNGSVGTFGNNASPVTNNSSIIVDLTNNSIQNTISGTGSISYNSGSGTITLNGTNPNTYSGGTLITAGSTLALLYGGTNLPGNVTNNGNIQLINSSSKGVVFLGASIGGSGSLTTTTNTGETNGTTVLTGDNTYTGGTYITGGATIQVGNGGTNGNLPSSGVISVAAGTTLAYDISGSQTITNDVTGAGALVQAGTGTIAIGFDNSTNQLALGWTKGGTIYVTNNNAFSYQGTINNAGIGSTLSANVGTGNTLTISLPISEGTGDTLTFVMPAGQTIIPDSGGITGSKGFVIMSGEGTLALNNANSADTWGGGTTINSGTLRIGTGVNNILGNAPISMYGGTLDLGGTTQGGANTFAFYGGTIQDGVLTLGKNSQFYGAGTISAIINGSSNNSLNNVGTPYTLVFATNNTTNNGTNVSFTGSWSIQTNVTAELANAGGLGSSTVTVASGGRVDINGYTYSTLPLNIFTNTFINTNVTPNTTNIVVVTNTSLSINGSGTDGDGAIYDSSSNGTGVLAGNLSLSGNASVGAANAMTISASITDTPNGTTNSTNPVTPGGYTLTVGSGSVTLSGSNNFATNTVASNAVENIGSVNSLGASNSLVVNGTLKLNSFYSGFSPALTNVTLGGGTLSSSISLTFATNQSIGGNGLLSVGTGTLTLNGSFNPSVGNTFTVNGGLILASSATVNTTVNYTNDTSANNYFSQVAVSGGPLNLSGSLLLNGTIFSVNNGISTSPFTSSFSAQLFNLTGGTVTAGDFNSVAWTGIDSGSSSQVSLNFTSTGANIWTYTDSSGDLAKFNSANGVLSFVAVPEPSTWALVIIGSFALTCSLIRRRKI